MIEKEEKKRKSFFIMDDESENEDVVEEKVEKVSLNEIDWEKPVIIKAKCVVNTFADDIAEALDNEKLYSELERFGVDVIKLFPKTSEDVCEETFRAFNDFIDDKVDYEQYTLSGILSTILEDYDDVVDYRKVMKILNDKNHDLLKLEYAIKHGKIDEIENASSHYEF